MSLLKICSSIEYCILLKRNSLLIRLSIKYLSCIIKTQQHNY